MNDYISISRINCWLQCPMKYRLQYIEQVPWAFKPAALALGVAVHAAIEVYYRGVQKNEPELLPHLVDVYNDSWKADTEGQELDIDSPEQVRIQGEKLLDTFVNNVHPSMIIAVEQEFRVPLVDPSTGEILDTDFLGRIDLIEADDSGTPVIVDHKTLARRPAEGEYDNNIQLMGYAYAARISEIADPDDDLLLRIDALLKTKTPGFDQRFVVQTPHDAAKFFLIASEVLRGIQTGVFPPHPGWWCKGCPVGYNCTLMNAEYMDRGAS